MKQDDRVVVGPQLGQDFAVLDFEDRYFIVKMNPITFATDEIGFYAVNVNANDVALSGAQPRWFSVSILLPEHQTDELLCEKIFKDIAQECDRQKIRVIGGHTEITIGLPRPIIVGTMMGEIPKNLLVTTHGAKPGDILLITKGIAIEGTSIIAREKESVLRQKHIPEDIIQKGKNFLHSPGISIVKEALLLAESKDVHAMHGLTEGGLTMGIVELARNSRCGVEIELSQIPILSPTQEFCNLFRLNPLQTIASGALLAAVPHDSVEKVIQLLQNNNIICKKIGIFTSTPKKYVGKTAQGDKISLTYSSTDEITKIFN